MNFDGCVEIILKHEGLYSDHPEDPGSRTKYGISQRAYPSINIKDLTVDHAKAIYKLDYWDKMRCDRLHPSTRLMVFDCAVNQGTTRATLYLQKCAGVLTDGVLGPITMKGISEVDPEFIITKFARYRHDAYSKNPRWHSFGAGWSSRLLDITIRSLVFSNAFNKFEFEKSTPT